MASHGKALVYTSKALPECFPATYDKAMLSSAELFAAKLNHALAVSGLSPTDVAKHCGVSKQAVNGWKKTGRIDKKHLPKLAELFHRDLSWWITPDAQDNAPSHDWPKAGHKKHSQTSRQTAQEQVLTFWPFKSISPNEFDRLNHSQKGAVEGFIRGLLAQEQIDKSAPDARTA